MVSQVVMSGGLAEFSNRSTPWAITQIRDSTLLRLMGSTVIEDEEDTRRFWFAVGILLHASVLVLLSFLAFLFFSSFMRNVVFFKRCSIPTVNCHPILFYFSALLSIYKQSRPEAPPLCLALQGVTGVCRNVFKERLFCIYVLFKPLIFFYKPETVEVLLSSTTLIDKSKEYELLSPWLGTGLLTRTSTAGSDVVQSGRPIFDDFFQHLWPYIGNNTANVVFQMVKRLWLIRIDQ
ncbi:uncharacterized protein TNCV_650431 [Trichonephila clavipes]|nr:uncharacterized protein TNCV_650431 [Trichonephila clavipes]